MQKLLTHPCAAVVLLALLGLGSLSAYAANAQKKQPLVTIENAWVRPTNAGQDVGAAFMTFISSQNTQLVGIECDVAESVEIHSMSMENGVMKMRMLDRLDLLAGKPYTLKPGGFHLMLFDLKKPLAVGDQINCVLSFKAKNAATVQQKIQAIVKLPSAATDHPDEHQH